MTFFTNSTDNKSEYPIIFDELITKLREDFPNELPPDYVEEYELGVLIGQQKVIQKLIAEKNYQEQPDDEEEIEE